MKNNLLTGIIILLVILELMTLFLYLDSKGRIDISKYDIGAMHTILTDTYNYCPYCGEKLKENEQ